MYLLTALAWAGICGAFGGWPAFWAALATIVVLS